jgi:hypothetical protein
MASHARIFFAGMGTTLVILGAGFGGGLMMAESALNEPVGYRRLASAPEPPSPARIVLPSSAEAAQPPQPPPQIAAAPQPPPEIQPVKEAQPPVERRVDKIDTRRLKRSSGSVVSDTPNAKQSGRQKKLSANNS